MNTDNNHVKKYFLDWLEGHIDDEKKKEINQHLKLCESCSTYFETMQIVMEESRPDQLPILEKDPFLPVRIKQLAPKHKHQDSTSAPVFGLSKSLTGSLVVVALVLGFLMGQLLVYSNQSTQETVEQVSITELFYEGMIQPNLGSNFEQAITEMEGDQQ